MIRRLFLAASLAALAFPACRSYGESPHRIGVGTDYFVALRNLDARNVDEKGFGYFVTYQYRPYGPVGLETDLEMMPNGYAGAKSDVYSPQAYLIIGSYLYLAAGIGGYYSDSKLSRNPFYAFRAGLDLDVVENVYFDLYAIYRFENWNDLSQTQKNIDSDTVFLGAALRFGL